MIVKVSALQTAGAPSGLPGRILQFPLIRSLLAALFIAVPITAHNLLAIYVLEKIPKPYFSYILDAETILVFLGIMYAFRIYTRVVERRTAHEFLFTKSLPESAAGFGISAGMVGVVVLLMAVLSYYKISSIGSPAILLHAFFTFGIGALVQEIVVRGILFRNVEELLGSWATLAIIAVLFGLVHLGNENATLWTSAAIAVADIALTGAYMLTRRMWLVWSMHFGWNFFQDGVFGMPNSGITSLASWITPDIKGPNWITGGSFGIEASYITLILSVAVGIVFLYYAIKKGQIVSPRWRWAKSE